MDGFEPTTRGIIALSVGPWAQLLDGDPVILPADLVLPPEVSRFTLGSTDRRWRLQVGQVRADLFLNRTTEDESLNTLEFAETGSSVFRQLLRSSNARVTRIAFTVHRAQPMLDPAMTLARFFCRDDIIAGPLRRAQTFELHAHKVYSPPGMPRVNSWVRWRTAALQPSGRSAIAVEQDLNTPAEDTAGASHGPAEINAFLHSAAREVDAILTLYLQARL